MSEVLVPSRTTPGKVDRVIIAADHATHCTCDGAFYSGNCHHINEIKERTMTTGLTFKKATKSQARLRLAIAAPSGAGKTYTSLRVATALAGPNGKVAVIDTERGSASKYAHKFTFDVLELTSFAPETYVEAIKAAESAGYTVIVIDSLSHAWSGKGGALEQVDNAAVRSKGNSYAAWREVTPHHNALVDAMLQSTAHVIATMRSKTEYVLETVNGKQVPRKVGMAPVQRDGMEYEFDVFGEMDQQNRLSITKTRCDTLNNAVIEKPGEDFAKTLMDWLSDGVPAARPAPPAPRAATPAAAPPAEDAPAIPDWKIYITRQMPKAGVTAEDLCRYLGCAKESLNADTEAWLSKNGGLESGEVVEALLAAARPVSQAAAQ